MCITEITRLGWILWKRSLRLEAEWKNWRNDIKIYTIDQYNYFLQLTWHTFE